MWENSQKGKVFSLANELPNGAIIFLDEIDSFAAARDNEMHEATRRILSVLLRQESILQIDGFEQDKKVVVIAATNRKEDLDPALISRFDTMIPFGLPDHRNRQQIVFNHQNVRRHLRLEICHEMVPYFDFSVSVLPSSCLSLIVIMLIVIFKGKKLLTMEKKGSRRWMSGGSNSDAVFHGIAMAHEDHRFWIPIRRDTLMARVRIKRTIGVNIIWLQPTK
ncbi:26S protease regulatory subunit 6A homolog B-like isoform X2 [Arachis ipaensis]|uniref:26S protease regulatory subunit 6A homolog B-like isoform X2 n=1 Tax=Arachis ipaensis TaxID=130454 RepID=UPI000A2B4F08|nr:26S protease regulatory subunit 6A homolog B-like isoform X2 [Arachis ipaensis]